MKDFKVSYGLHQKLESEMFSKNGYQINDKYSLKYSISGNENSLNDDIFLENDEFIFYLSGIIYNKADLIKNRSNYQKGIYDLFKSQGKELYRSLNGSFHGFLFDKKSENLAAFTDKLKTKQLFYYIDKGIFLCSSSIDSIYEILKSLEIPYSLDIQGAYMILSYGYVMDNYTLCEKIKKNRFGQSLEYNHKSGLKQFKYYQLQTDYKVFDKREIIEELDRLFRLAVKRQFDKDIEQNKKHIVGLSGGLDSRMTSWVAHELGYEDQLNFTFSQSDYLDETIPKQITSYLQHEWLFKSLDNGLFLKDHEEITRLSGGHSVYYGLAHSHSLMKLINFSDFGLVHTGQLGDAVVGSMLKKWPMGNESLVPKPYSSKLSNKVKRIDYWDNYSPEELMLIERGFVGANFGLLSTQKYAETYSPFYDIDFMDFSLSINPNLRINHNLYKEWIKEKHPSMIQFKWEAIDAKIDSPHIRYKNNDIYLNQIFSKIKRRILQDKYKVGRKNMNPLDYWYQTNNQLRNYLDRFFKDNINLVDRQPQLQNDMIMLYEAGSGLEKTQVITLLSAIKIYFS